MIYCCSCAHGHCRFTLGAAICSFSRLRQVRFGQSHKNVFALENHTLIPACNQDNAWKHCWQREKGTSGHCIYWCWNCDKTTFLAVDAYFRLWLFYFAKLKFQYTWASNSPCKKIIPPLNALWRQNPILCFLFIIRNLLFFPGFSYLLLNSYV